MGPPTDDGGSPAPIDRPILEYLRTHLGSLQQVERASITQSGHTELVVTLADEYYPETVASATLVIRWYTNDDFSAHYRERHDGREWACRWDRHPNPHNTREHFHPPPNASQEAEDASWPADYRAVVDLVFGEIAERIDELWA
jgi:hypothetical protein